MSIFDTVLHIPAEARPFGPPRVFTRVSLPLVARPGARFVVAGLGAAVAAAACLWLAFMLAGAAGDTAKYGAAVVFALVAFVPGAVAVTAAHDAMSAQPVLTIAVEGLHDRRLGEDLILWDRVAAASIVASANGIAAVRITLAEDGARRFNPFRIGGWSADWRRSRRDRLIALALLDRRAHDLAHTIVALAARHGASAEGETRP